MLNLCQCSTAHAWTCVREVNEAALYCNDHYKSTSGGFGSQGAAVRTDQRGREMMRE